MKQLLTLVFASFALAAFGQSMTIQEWDEQAKTNIRLLPRYARTSVKSVSGSNSTPTARGN